MGSFLNRDGHPLSMERESPTAVNVSRRRFLVNGGVLLAAGMALPKDAWANGFWSRPRTLYLKRMGQKGTIRETYWANGRIYQPGYNRICQLMRDSKTGQVAPMSLRVLDILTGIQGWFRYYNQDRLIIVTSGYRSKATNASTPGAVKDSRHEEADAVDFTIQDVSVEYIGKVARSLRGGGVGVYPKRNFVHVDGGRERFWRG